MLECKIGCLGLQAWLVVLCHSTKEGPASAWLVGRRGDDVRWTRRPRQRINLQRNNQLVVFQLIIIESSWFLRTNILQTWARLTDIVMTSKFLKKIVSNNLSFLPFLWFEMHIKLSKSFQVYFMHIHFSRN